MELQYTDKFKKDYKKLPLAIQKKTNEQLKVLISDFSYPSLRVKKVKGQKDIFEVSITMQYRLLFLFNANSLVLLRIGPHDILNRL